VCVCGIATASRLCVLSVPLRYCGHIILVSSNIITHILRQLLAASNIINLVQREHTNFRRNRSGYGKSGCLEHKSYNISETARQSESYY